MSVFGPGLRGSALGLSGGNMRLLGQEAAEDPGLLQSALETLGRPGFVVRNLLAGNLQGALGEGLVLGSQLVSAPFTGGLSLLDPTISPLGVSESLGGPGVSDFTNRETHVEASDLAEAHGFDAPDEGWQRIAFDIVGGILTDPLTLVTGGGGGLARGGLTGLAKPAALKVLARNLGTTTRGRAALLAGKQAGKSADEVAEGLMTRDVLGRLRMDAGIKAADQDIARLTREGLLAPHTMRFGVGSMASERATSAAMSAMINPFQRHFLMPFAGGAIGGLPGAVAGYGLSKVSAVDEGLTKLTQEFTRKIVNRFGGTVPGIEALARGVIGDAQAAAAMAEREGRVLFDGLGAEVQNAFTRKLEDNGEFIREQALGVEKAEAELFAYTRGLDPGLGQGPPPPSTLAPTEQQVNPLRVLSAEPHPLAGGRREPFRAGSITEEARKERELGAQAFAERGASGLGIKLSAKGGAAGATPEEIARAKGMDVNTLKEAVARHPMIEQMGVAGYTPVDLGTAELFRGERFAPLDLEDVGSLSNLGTPRPWDLLRDVPEGNLESAVGRMQRALTMLRSSPKSSKILAGKKGWAFRKLTDLEGQLKNVIARAESDPEQFQAAWDLALARTKKRFFDNDVFWGSTKENVGRHYMRTMSKVFDPSMMRLFLRPEGTKLTGGVFKAEAKLSNALDLSKYSQGVMPLTEANRLMRSAGLNDREIGEVIAHNRKWADQRGGPEATLDRSQLSVETMFRGDAGSRLIRAIEDSGYDSILHTSWGQTPDVAVLSRGSLKSIEEVFGETTEWGKRIRGRRVELEPGPGRSGQPFGTGPSALAPLRGARPKAGRPGLARVRPSVDVLRNIQIAARGVPAPAPPPAAVQRAGGDLSRFNISRQSLAQLGPEEGSRVKALIEKATMPDEAYFRDHMIAEALADPALKGVGEKRIGEIYDWHLKLMQQAQRDLISDPSLSKYRQLPRAAVVGDRLILNKRQGEWRVVEHRVNGDYVLESIDGTKRLDPMPLTSTRRSRRKGKESVVVPGDYKITGSASGAGAPERIQDLFYAQRKFQPWVEKELGKFAQPAMRAFMKARKFGSKQDMEDAARLALEKVGKGDLANDRLAREHGLTVSSLPALTLQRFREHQAQMVKSKFDFYSEAMPEFEDYFKSVQASVLPKDSAGRQAFSEVNRRWKSLLTTVNPAFHARNWLGALFQALHDNRVAPVEAFRIWRNTGLEALPAFGAWIGRLMGANTKPLGSELSTLLAAADGSASAWEKAAKIKIGEHTGQELLQKATGRVLRQNQAEREVVGDLLGREVAAALDPKVRLAETRRGKASNPFVRVLDRWSEIGADASTFVEDRMRLGTMIALVKSGVDLEDAATSVNRAFVDYSIQSTADYWLRQFVPFARFTVGTASPAVRALFSRPAYRAIPQKSLADVERQDKPAPEKVTRGLAIPLGGGDYLQGLGMPIENVDELLRMIPARGRELVPGLRRGMAQLQPGLGSAIAAGTNTNLYWGGPYWRERSVGGPVASLLESAGMAKPGRDGVTRVSPGVAAAMDQLPVTRQIGYLRAGSKAFGRDDFGPWAGSLITGLALKETDQKQVVRNLAEAYFNRKVRQGDLKVLQRFYQGGIPDPELQQLLKAYNAMAKQKKKKKKRVF